MGSAVYGISNFDSPSETGREVKLKDGKLVLVPHRRWVERAVGSTLLSAVWVEGGC